MPAPVAVDAPPGAGSRRQALAALCVTEIVSYGVLYYAFPVLAGQITAGTGWSRTAVTLLLGLLPGSAGLLVAASVLAGAVRAVFTLTEATLVGDYWGPNRYAAVNGVFNAPITAAGALALSVGAAIATATGSYPTLFAVLAAAAATGAGLAAAAPPPAGRRGRSGGGVQPGCQPPDPGG